MYSFKQECKVYISNGIQKWKLEVYPDLNFSQTFNEQATSVKTLHDQNAVFEEATINSANPANFNFTVLLVNGTDFDIINGWLTTYTGNDEALLTYDIYVDTGVDIYKIRKGVLERATFIIARESLITVSINGSAAQLTHFGVSGAVIPGALQSRDSTLEPIISRLTSVELDGVQLENLSGITLELSNEVQWVEHKTLHKSLYVTSASDTMYPEAFAVSKKVLSGTIVQYLINTANAQTWSTNSTLRIRVGDSSGYYIDLNTPRVVVTNRVQPDSVFMQTYDFRMLDNPAQILIGV
jgi:hypothetical protein